MQSVNETGSVKSVLNEKYFFEKNCTEIRQGDYFQFFLKNKALYEEQTSGEVLYFKIFW